MYKKNIKAAVFAEAGDRHPQNKSKATAAKRRRFAKLVKFFVRSYCHASARYKPCA